MRKGPLIGALTLFCANAAAYDSVACGPSDEAPDCEGLEAARTPWLHSEHAQIWLRTRDIAGLPTALDESFFVETRTAGGSVAGFSSLAPAPLDLATAIQRRTIELAAFAQLPDKAYALWDWGAGNEGCPPSNTVDFDGCHAFTAHMGWLNSNHFLPQAEDVFHRYHDLALERAAACQRMGSVLQDAGRDENALLKACDREALLLEAIAHHYLQDAWSMGHMWQRWGSPDLGDFAAVVSADDSLSTIKSIGDAVGRGSGIIHGAAAITTLADAMCAPDDGVAFVHGTDVLPGAGDLFLDRVNDDIQFADQRELLYGCAATRHAGGLSRFLAVVRRSRAQSGLECQSRGLLHPTGDQSIHWDGCFDPSTPRTLRRCLCRTRGSLGERRLSDGHRA